MEDKSIIQVKYRNDFNRVNLSHLTKSELDFFFSICSKVRNMENRKISFSFYELRVLSNYKPTAKSRFVHSLESTRDKIMNLSYIETNGLNSIKMNIIITFEINADTEDVIVEIHPDYTYFFNDLKNKFTSFYLFEYTNLKSKYTKLLYSQLLQFKSSGFLTLSIDEFRTILGIPDGYKMRNINQKVLLPIEKELSQLFEVFNIKKIKKSNGAVERIEFYFNGRKNNYKESSDNLPKIPMYNWLNPN